MAFDDELVVVDYFQRGIFEFHRFAQDVTDEQQRVADGRPHGNRRRRDLFRCRRRAAPAAVATLLLALTLLLVLSLAVGSLASIRREEYTRQETRDQRNINTRVVRCTTVQLYV